jgi:hypothetical protein
MGDETPHKLPAMLMLLPPISVLAHWAALMNAGTSWKTVHNLTSKIADKLRDEVMRLREPLMAMLRLRILSKHCKKQSFQK